MFWSWPDKKYNQAYNLKKVRTEAYIKHIAIIGSLISYIQYLIIGEIGFVNSIIFSTNLLINSDIEEDEEREGDQPQN